MSYILDALKKAEMEKLKKSSPQKDSFKLLASTKRDHFPWLLTITAITLMNLLLWGGILFI